MSSVEKAIEIMLKSCKDARWDVVCNAMRIMEAMYDEDVQPDIIVDNTKEQNV